MIKSLKVKVDGDTVHALLDAILFANQAVDNGELVYSQDREGEPDESTIIAQKRKAADTAKLEIVLEQMLEAEEGGAIVYDPKLD